MGPVERVVPHFREDLEQLKARLLEMGGLAEEEVRLAVRGLVERGGDLLWSKTFRSGEAEMCHSLANIEHHHFKYEAHRRPGDVHVHFFGTDGLSFSDGVSLKDGDLMQVSVTDYGRPLRNPLRVAGTKPNLISVKGLE